MRLSLKYKFILSFIVTEVLFISVIVFYNFSSLHNLSKSLIDEKVETANKLFTELIQAPLVVYDKKTLDNAIDSFTNIKNIVAVEILDKENRVISHVHIDAELSKKIFDARSKKVEAEGRTFILSVLPIKMHDKAIGSAKIIFEVTDSLKTIEDNRNFTFLVSLLGIILSAMSVYIIGNRLTHSLERLTSSAEKIAEDDQVIIPNLGRDGDEIFILSKAMRIMQEQIAQRNRNLNDVVQKLQDSSALLKKERDFHSALLDQASSIVLVMNPKGEVVLSNKVVETLTGYTQNEVIGKVAWEMFIPKEEQERVKRVFSCLVTGDFPNTYENTWIVKDGTHIPFTWSNSCVLDENGNIEYIIAIGIDITERNKTEQTIKTLLNSPVVSIILISVDERILEINDIASKRLNNTPDRLKGKYISDFSTAESSQLRGRYINELLITKKPLMYEEKQDGKIFKNHLYPILDNDGNVLQISIFSHDITEFKKAQKELDKYIRLVDENVIISHTDTEGITTSVSKAFCKLTGYTAKELIGKEYNIIRHPDMPATTYEDLWATIQKGKMWRGEIKNQTKDGQSYWVETSIYPDFDDDKNIIGYNAIRQDITNRKKLEAISITDPLTKLYNRRYFDDIFDTEIKRVKREKKVFCLLSLDVDNFKMYNDTYGHQMGDEVLEMIAHILKEYMKRAGDFAFRIGGEEFSAIFSEEDKNSIYDFTDKIRKSVEEKKIEHKTNNISPYVTVSIGVSFIDFSKNSKVTTDKSALYNHTDELLYKAKAKGRNVVVVEEKKD